MRAVLFLTVILVGSLGATAAPADDFEKIPYVCRCSCHDYQPSQVRVRVPGGGYGYELQHLPLWNPDLSVNTVDFPIRGVSRDQCRELRGQACRGKRSWREGYPTVAGWLDRCRWSYDPY